MTPGITATTWFFLHERKTPSGEPRLVVVHLYATQVFDERRIREANAADVDHYFKVFKMRILKAWSYKLGTPTTSHKAGPQYDLRLFMPDSEMHEIAKVSGDDAAAARSGTTKIDYGQRLRIFGGQPDPNDPTHFTIRYQINDREGIIDGNLKNDSILLRPRNGKPVTTESMPSWKLSADDLPTVATTRGSTIESPTR